MLALEVREAGQQEDGNFRKDKANRHSPALKHRCRGQTKEKIVKIGKVDTGIAALANSSSWLPFVAVCR